MTRAGREGARPLRSRLLQPVIDLRTARAVGTTTVSGASTRLLVGPVNSAGQARAWAGAAATLPDVAAANVVHVRPGDAFRFPADHAVPRSVAVGNRVWQRAQRRAVGRRFTHVLIESGQQLFGPADSVAEQAADLARDGVRVGLVWHGSDIRLPSAHARREADSPFAGGRYADGAALEETAARNLALAQTSGLPSFVSTPDLLALVPGATWLPVVVDPADWRASSGPVLERARPVVVHAPSRAGLKGSDLIEDTMARLHDEGVVEYRQLAGVAHADMPRVYGDADIVLDQFSLGIYGVAACEALAAGRVVVSHVDAGVRATVRALTGEELPILQSRAGDLEATIRDILQDRDAHRARAAFGPAFVTAVHDGRRSADALAGFLGAQGSPTGPMGDLTDA